MYGVPLAPLMLIAKNPAGERLAVGYIIVPSLAFRSMQEGVFSIDVPRGVSVSLGCPN